MRRRLRDGNLACDVRATVAAVPGSEVVVVAALTADARRAHVLDHVQCHVPWMAGRSPDVLFECHCTLGGALCAPFGPIHWAGTETASEWRSYMEGAEQSRERAAAKLLAAC